MNNDGGGSGGRAANLGLFFSGAMNHRSSVADHGAEMWGGLSAGSRPLVGSYCCPSYEKAAWKTAAG
jgi:hypothetical protein